MTVLRKPLSLRSRITLLVSATAFLTAFTVGALNYYQTSRIAVDKAVETLAGKTRLATLKVKAAYAEMKNDAMLVSLTPPMQGLIRSIRNNQADPHLGAGAEIWRDRVSTIFASFLSARPYYAKIRYIGLADGGKELVRVNRHSTGWIETVPPEEMQKTAAEDYFQAGLQLAKDHFHIARVSFNREWGHVDPVPIAALRVVLPIFDEEGQRFGMIVINADYDKFLAHTLSSIAVEEEIYIADRFGDYVHRDEAGNVSKLQAQGTASRAPAGFIERILKGGTAEGRFSADGRIGYFQREMVEPGKTDAFIVTYLLVPTSKLLAGADALIDQSLITGLVLVAVASVVAMLFVAHLTRPVEVMTARIAAFSRGRSDTLDLPVNLRDEIGDMARAFRDLVAQLDLSQARNVKLSLQLESFIANAVDGVVLVDEGGLIQEVNPAFLKLFGYERDELIGETIRMIMPGVMRDRHDGALRFHRDGERRKFQGMTSEEEARHKNGTRFPVFLSLSEVELPDRRIYTGIIRDMTAMREAQAKIERYTAELERSNAELDQFAYVASHDLKAPLRVIDNASRWLEEDLSGKLSGEDLENMTLLRSRVRRMEKLLDDLLEYSRVGKVEDNSYQEAVSGGTLLDDVLLLLEPPAAMKVTYDEAFHEILVNRMPLQRVVYNLINNAIKHHHTGAGTIHVGVMQDGGEYRFTVGDDGPGIAPEYHKSIFEMFHTLKPRDQVEGSGMGLALVKKTVEHFGGSISVASEPGKGTEFAFTWPVRQPAVMLAGKAA